MSGLRFFAAADPQARSCCSWEFVYYHGTAEEMNALRQEESDWPDYAPDQVACNTPMPSIAGEYPGWLYGLEVVAVLAMRSGHYVLTGRVVAMNDPVALAHARDPSAWR